MLCRVNFDEAAMWGCIRPQGIETYRDKPNWRGRRCLHDIGVQLLNDILAHSLAVHPLHNLSFALVAVRAAVTTNRSTKALQVQQLTLHRHVW